jgi:hypothetical protein
MRPVVSRPRSILCEGIRKLYAAVATKQQIITTWRDKIILSDFVRTATRLIRYTPFNTVSFGQLNTWSFGQSLATPSLNECAIEPRLYNRLYSRMNPTTQVNDSGIWNLCVVERNFTVLSWP